jgi:hypothetical protein
MESCEYGIEAGISEEDCCGWWSLSFETWSIGSKVVTSQEN